MLGITISIKYYRSLEIAFNYSNKCDVITYELSGYLRHSVYLSIMFCVCIRLRFYNLEFKTWPHFLYGYGTWQCCGIY